MSTLDVPLNAGCHMCGATTGVTLRGFGFIFVCADLGACRERAGEAFDEKLAELRRSLRRKKKTPA